MPARSRRQPPQRHELHHKAEPSDDDEASPALRRRRERQTVRGHQNELAFWPAAAGSRYAGALAPTLSPARWSEDGGADRRGSGSAIYKARVFRVAEAMNAASRPATAIRPPTSRKRACTPANSIQGCSAT